MRMPTCFVLALMTMQPRLEARESFLEAKRIALGSGRMKEQDAAAIVRDWAMKAEPGAPKGKADAGLLMAAGFAVRRVKRTTKKV